MYGNNSEIMVAIPCEEYSKLIRKGAMLDILLSQPEDAASCRLAELVGVIKEALAGGNEANA